MEIIEGSHAVAKTIQRCNVGVISAYPITPQTHIVEDLEKIHANGEGGFEFVRAESEFAAASIVLGSSAAGVRSYTATSSQGLLLMTEVIFCIAGMRLPIVMTIANRAVSAPINIWNDQQDAVTVRDSGWLSFYGETNQEVVDLHVLAFKVGEENMLPVFVNMDGFVLTHTYEPLVLPPQTGIKRFINSYHPPKDQILDITKPRTLGAFADPSSYMEIREQLHHDIVATKDAIKKAATEYKKVFGRSIGDNGLIETYKTRDADTIIVSMGSVCGTIKEVVDTMRKKGKKVGLLKIICYRPFPDAEIISVLKKAKYIPVIEKDISLGSEGVLASDINRACYNHTKGKIQSFVVGLGGRDVTQNMIIKIISDIRTRKDDTCTFVGKI